MVQNTASRTPSPAWQTIGTDPTGDEHHTGAEGSAIALRLGHAGYRVIFGTRDSSKGARVVADLNEILGDTALEFAENASAAQAAEVVIMTVPYNGCDVLVCSDNADARKITLELIAKTGLRGLDAGPICNSAAAEALTSILIFLNRKYKISGSGIKITGLDNVAVRQ